MFAQQLLNPKRIEPEGSGRCHQYPICPMGMNNRLLINEKSGFFLFINNWLRLKEINVC